MGKLAWCVKALHSESEGSRLKSHKVLGRTLGPNLVTRLPVIFGSKSVSKRSD